MVVQCVLICIKEVKDITDTFTVNYKTLKYNLSKITLQNHVSIQKLKKNMIKCDTRE